MNATPFIVGARTPIAAALREMMSGRRKLIVVVD